MRSFVLYILIGFTGMVFGAEIVSSHITQSLVLLISSYHMLYNFLSLLLLVIDHRMSKGKTLKNTFGWARVKVVGILVNMLCLTALSFAACVEAIQTIVHALHEDTEPRYPLLLIIHGVVNFVLNVSCFLLIGGYTHHQGCSMMTQKNDPQVSCITAEEVNSQTNGGKIKVPQWFGDHKILDFSRDVSSSITVIACGCIIYFMDGLILKYADAILVFCSATILFTTTYPFLRESGLILLQSIPSHIDVQSLMKRLIVEFPEVQNVHDLHIWRLTTAEIIATVHIILSSSDTYTKIEGSLKEFFLKEGISSVTIQPELTNGIVQKMEKNPHECILQCSLNNNCGALTCCGPLHPKSNKQIRHRCTTNDNKNESSVTDMNGTTVIDVPNTLARISELSAYDFSNIHDATETTV